MHGFIIRYRVVRVFRHILLGERESVREQVYWVWVGQKQQNDVRRAKTLISLCIRTHSDQIFLWPHEETLGPWLPTEHQAKTDRTAQAGLNLRGAHL